MEVRELKEALSVFNPATGIVVAIPQRDVTQHELRHLHVAGHIDHPGEVKNDHAIHALDLVCDHWDDPVGAGKITTVGELAKAIEPFPDPMHVRIAVPIEHDSISHRMLDIAMLGHAVGAPAGAGVHVITENWETPTQVIKEIPGARPKVEA